MNECFDEEIPTSSPEQDATGEEMRIATWQMVYPQRALTLVIVSLIILLIIGLVGHTWTSQTQDKCGVPSS